MDPPSPAAGDLLARNAGFAAEFAHAGLPTAPRLRLAVVACMDARLDVAAALGLEPGDSHVLRNAGGVVTEDVIRSLSLSQQRLGTREILLVHHTECGLQGVSEDEFRAALAAETGVTPPWAVEAFSDPYDDVRQSIRRLRLTPFVPHKEHVRGFVYDVATGVLHDVGAG